MAKTTKTKRKHNYLNNRDILKEIHKSKKTYCTYRDIEADSDFDIILHDVNDIFGSRTVQVKDDDGELVDAVVPVITLAKQNKAAVTAKNNYDAAIKAGEKVKQAEFAVDPNSYADEDIVFRVMEWEHIPFAPPKPKKVVAKRKKTKASKPVVEKPVVKKHVKVNFPPFYHYRLKDNTPFQVAKSHWKGEYDNGNFPGEFCKEHGAMTEKLALMFMKLCERYATRSNWRSYTYNDEMRGQALLQLAQIGLQFNEDKSDNPFAYYTAAITNSFTRVLNIEKRNQAIRDDILEANDIMPSFTRQNENDLASNKESLGFDSKLYRVKRPAQEK